jgi:hypothetical protein
VYTLRGQTVSNAHSKGMSLLKEPLAISRYPSKIPLVERVLSRRKVPESVGGPKRQTMWSTLMVSSIHKALFLVHFR